MATTTKNQASGSKTPAPKKATSTDKLVLKKETIQDLQSVLKEAARARQSKRVCVA